MASTNKTSNIKLSQFLATDKPAWITDYNEDMGKIDEAMMLKAKYDPQGKNEDVFAYADRTLKDYVYYVSTTGKNTNDGTEEAPLATIMEAVNRTPVICNSLRIILEPGGYGEHVLVQGKTYLNGFSIMGSSILESSYTYTMRSFHAVNCSGTMMICGITFNNYAETTGEIRAMQFNGCNILALVKHCRMTVTTPVGATTTACLAEWGASVVLLECEVRNKTYVATSLFNGEISALDLKGGGNSNVFYSGYGGVTTESSGNTITGTTRYGKYAGGIVIKPDGTLV